jgi:predicted nucleic acid-binding protein
MGPRRRAPQEGCVALITLDTSAILALLDRREREHRRVRAALVEDRGPYLIPAWILAECCYLTATRLGDGVLDTLLADFEATSYTIDCGDGDVPRIRQLVRRYSDLPLSAADAAVIACAERSGGRILSVDADFGVVAKEGKIIVLPA